jgi:cation transport protein ChaC
MLWKRRRRREGAAAPPQCAGFVRIEFGIGHPAAYGARADSPALHWLLHRIGAGKIVTDRGRISPTSRFREMSFRRKQRDRTTTGAASVAVLMRQNDDGDFWVFGYGSLMWRPGFEFLDSALAWVHGYHRSLCIFSHVHRGTPERPGLVLGLDLGGSCQGVAFRIAAEAREATLSYLRERELVTSVYQEKTVGLRFAEGGTARALTYIVDRNHRQYAGRLPLEEVTRLVANGVGVTGDNPAYVRNTYEHLLQLDIHDDALAKVVRQLDSEPKWVRRQGR